MANTAMIHARTDQKLKADVEGILKTLGLSTSEAINIFFSQIRLSKGIPFDVRIPNKTTRETIKKAKEGKELHRYDSVDDFFDKMDL